MYFSLLELELGKNIVNKIELFTIGHRSLLFLRWGHRKDSTFTEVFFIRWDNITKKQPIRYYTKKTVILLFQILIVSILFILTASGGC